MGRIDGAGRVLESTAGVEVAAIRRDGGVGVNVVLLGRPHVPEAEARSDVLQEVGIVVADGALDVRVAAKPQIDAAAFALPSLGRAHIGLHGQSPGSHIAPDVVRHEGVGAVSGERDCRVGGVRREDVGAIRIQPRPAVLALGVQTHRPCELGDALVLMVVGARGEVVLVEQSLVRRTSRRVPHLYVVEVECAEICAKREAGERLHSVAVELAEFRRSVKERAVRRRAVGRCRALVVEFVNDFPGVDICRHHHPVPFAIGYGCCSRASRRPAGRHVERRAFRRRNCTYADGRESVVLGVAWRRVVVGFVAKREPGRVPETGIVCPSGMRADVHLYLHLAGRDGRPEWMRHVRYPFCFCRTFTPENSVISRAADIGSGRAGAMHGASPAIHAKRLDNRAARKVTDYVLSRYIHIVSDVFCQETVWRVCAGRRSAEVAAAA